MTIEFDLPQQIPEMRGLVTAAESDASFTLGASTTLASAIELMTERARAEPDNYAYLAAGKRRRRRAEIPTNQRTKLGSIFHVHQGR